MTRRASSSSSHILRTIEPVNVESIRDSQDMIVEHFEPVENIESIESIKIAELAESEESEASDEPVESTRSLRPELTNQAHKEFEFGSGAITQKRLVFALYYPMDGKDQFIIPNPELLVGKGFFYLQCLHFLIETSCLTKIISIDSLKKVGIGYRYQDNFKTVTTNLALQKVGVTIQPVTISIGTYTETMRFIVYRIILGK